MSFEKRTMLSVSTLSSQVASTLQENDTPILIHLGPSQATWPSFQQPAWASRLTVNIIWGYAEAVSPPLRTICATLNFSQFPTSSRIATNVQLSVSLKRYQSLSWDGLSSDTIQHLCLEPQEFYSG
jgi:carboxypeptidase C (cathepsin A)